jgi:hypothetical protein
MTQTIGLVDEPSPYDTLATWEQHLAEVEKLSPEAWGRQFLLDGARKMVEHKRAEAASNSDSPE